MQVIEERPETLRSATHRVRTGHGNLYVTVSMTQDGRPFEVFATHGKSGTQEAANVESMTRLASVLLRMGADVWVIIDQLQGITDTPVWDQGRQVLSVPDAVAHVLRQYAGSETSRPHPGGMADASH